MNNLIELRYLSMVDPLNPLEKKIVAVPLINNIDLELIRDKASKAGKSLRQ